MDTNNSAHAQEWPTVAQWWSGGVQGSGPAPCDTLCPCVNVWKMTCSGEALQVFGRVHLPLLCPETFSLWVPSHPWPLHCLHSHCQRFNEHLRPTQSSDWNSWKTRCSLWFSMSDIFSPSALWSESWDPNRSICSTSTSKAYYISKYSFWGGNMVGYVMWSKMSMSNVSYLAKVLSYRF